MTAADLARFVNEAKLVPLGEALIVLRVAGPLDDATRRAIADSCDRVFGPEGQRPPVIILDQYTTLTAVDLTDAVAVMKHDAPLSVEDQAAVRRWWAESWRGRTEPPLIIASGSARIDAAASTAQGALAHALLDTAHCVSVQDRAKALLERFWVVERRR